jgi:transposase
VVRIANRCPDQARRRVQNDTLGHRGRRRDPLYRNRLVWRRGCGSSGFGVEVEHVKPL